MANRIDPSTVSWRATQHSRPVPFGDWFNGGTWKLTPGEDFDGPLPSFRAYLYRMAREFDYRLRTRVVAGHLYIQALASDGSTLPAPAPEPPTH